MDQPSPKARVARLADLDWRAHLDDPASKQRYVTRMFDIIAPRYDAFTRWFSFGMDGRWKRRLVTWAAEGLSGPATILDLACGTGDLALALAEDHPAARVCALDASPEMIALARQRGQGRQAAVAFQLGDMMALPHATASLDLVTVGYGLRNVPDHRVALAEIARVLRPGGRVLILDFTRPEWAPWRWCFLGYLQLAGRLFGRCWHGDGSVYAYIPRSIARFVGPRRLATDLAAAGLTPERLVSRLGSGIVLLEAVRTCDRQSGRRNQAA